MKKFIVSFVLLLVFNSITLMAQLPPHPNGGGGPGGGTIPVGGGAPLGGSLLILLSLSVGYSLRKIYDLRKKGLEGNH
jgi:hypothetical protein